MFSISLELIHSSPDGSGYKPLFKYKSSIVSVSMAEFKLYTVIYPSPLLRKISIIVSSIIASFSSRVVSSFNFKISSIMSLVIEVKHNTSLCFLWLQLLYHYFLIHLLHK